MAGKTISQRIALEGGDELKKKLEELGAAGEKSFKQIQAAAEKTKVDPAQFAQFKQALDGLISTGSQLANQFLQLAKAASTFGTQGAQATAAVTAGLNQANAAAQQTGRTMQQAGQQVAGAGEAAGTSLISTANKWRLAAVGIAGAIAAVVSALTKGAVETGAKIAEQAEKLKLSTQQWVELRQAIAAAGGSFDEFVKGAGKAISMLTTAKEAIGKTSKDFKVLDADGNAVTVTVQSMRRITDQAAKAFLDLGISMQMLKTGDTKTILTEVAAAINRMAEGATKAAAGVKFFGDEWRKVIAVLLAGTTATVESEEAMRRKSRELTADQADMAKNVKEAWADLGAAIRATRDQIGAIFAPGELARVQWLTQLVDESRLLLKEWLELDAAGRKVRLGDVGEGAAATAFKILVAISEQLAGIWRDVLVPAGEKLMDIVKGIAGSFEGVMTEQVIAGFITLTSALIGIAIAMKGIGFVLSPITAVISLIASLGPILIPLIALVVLFWDQISAGAEKVAELIPNSLEGMRQAFQALFAGDLASFWILFSASVVTAFATIKQAILQSEGPVGDLARAISTIGQQIPGTIELIVQALLALGRAAEGTATVLNRLFGTQLTGTDVVAIAVIAQMTGALQALASVATAVAASLATVVSVIGLIAAAGATTAATILGVVAAAALVIAAAAIAVAIYLDEIKAGAQAAWDAIVAGAAAAKQAITDFITTPVANAWQWIVAAFDAVVAQIVAKAETLKNILQGLVAPGGLAGLAAQAGAGVSGDKFATGGWVGGRGTGTSDSNLAWLSRGEYITPARAVRQPGVLAFLEALRRSGGNLRDVLDGMGRFALGGMVAPTLSIPAFAGGSSNRDLGTLHLALPGGETFAVRASVDVVDQLRKAAAMAQVRSGGRKPSRYS